VHQVGFIYKIIQGARSTEHKITLSNILWGKKTVQIRNDIF